MVRLHQHDPNTYEVPNALRVRPTVTIRPFPGKVIRLPRRAGTIMLAAVAIWFIGVGFVHLPLIPLAGIVVVPAGMVTFIIERRIHGKTPLVWTYIWLRHASRSKRLIARRLAVRSRQLGRRSF
jgi:hypothetical protein